MYTINAITPLLNPDISDEEARSVVDGLTDEQKDIANMAFTKAFRETMARLKDSDSQDALVRVLREVAEEVCTNALKCDTSRPAWSQRGSVNTTRIRGRKLAIIRAECLLK